MGKPTCDGSMGIRAAEELYREADRRKCKIGGLLRHYGITVYIFNLWKAGGATPGGYYLARMHEAGCDVIYILTGQRKAASDAATSEAAEE